MLARHPRIAALAASLICTIAATLVLVAAPSSALAYPSVSNPSSVTVSEGQTATFSVWYSVGEEASVQWFVSTDGGSTWSKVDGATTNGDSSSYTTPAATASMSGWQYKCAVWDEDGAQESSSATLTVEHQHVWSAASYEWSGGEPAGSTATCTAKRTCTKGNETESEKVSAAYAQKATATCTEDGSGTYTASFESTWASAQTKNVVIAALGHSFTSYVSGRNATCTKDGTKTATCDHGCGATDTITDEGSALGHDYASAWSSDADGHNSHRKERSIT